MSTKYQASNLADLKLKLGMTPVSDKSKTTKPRKNNRRSESILAGRSIEIMYLRDGEKKTFREIRKCLSEKGLKVAHSTIFEFYKKCTGKK